MFDWSNSDFTVAAAVFIGWMAFSLIERIYQRVLDYFIGVNALPLMGLELAISQVWKTAGRDHPAHDYNCGQSHPKTHEQKLLYADYLAEVCSVAIKIYIDGVPTAEDGSDPYCDPRFRTTSTPRPEVTSRDQNSDAL